MLHCRGYCSTQGTPDLDPAEARVEVHAYKRPTISFESPESRVSPESRSKDTPRHDHLVTGTAVTCKKATMNYNSIVCLGS